MRNAEGNMFALLFRWSNCSFSVLYESDWQAFHLNSVAHPGLRGPPGLPGALVALYVTKGPRGLSGRNGPRGHQGPAGNGAVT